MNNLIVIILTLNSALLSINLSKAQQSPSNTLPDDIGTSKAFKRLEWFYQPRAFPDNQIPLEKYVQERNREIQKIKNQSTRCMEPEWISIGPDGYTPLPVWENWGIMTGRIRAIAVHPADPETVYIGAACGGIWKTIDGGENWMDIGRNLESLSYGAIAIDPSNPDIIYAGTGESAFFYVIIHITGKGLYKSSDAGNTWQNITNGFGDMTNFSDLVVSPHNTSLLFAALASGNCYTGENMDNEGIWKSTDGGITWTKTLDLTHAYDVAVHPADENIVYAAIGGMTGNSGFYISSDQGETWTQSISGLQAPGTIARMHFDIALSEPDIIYSVVYQPGNGGAWTGTSRAYKSNNGGVSWFQISEGVNLGGFGTVWMDQGFYDLCIAVDPSDPDHVFIGNIELHKTTDGSVFSPVRPYGSNVNGGLVHPDYHKFAYAPSNADYFYIGCDGGLFKSVDGGQTANSQNPGLEIMQFYRIASHPTDPEIVMGGLQDVGHAITFDGGDSWQQVTAGDGMECFFDYEDPNIVYASIQNGRLAKSNDGGLTFPSWIKYVAGSWISPFFMHPSDHNTLYVANKSINRSTDAGSSWTIIAQDVAPASISAMAQSRVNPDNMIFATGGGDSPIPDSVFLVKISTDEGFTWTDVTNNIPGETRWISRVVTDPQEANTMYVLRTGFSDGNKVWKTTDLGESWTNISGDLPDLPCSDIFVDPDNNEHLYVANDIGVYLSTDGGNSWNYASYGMPFVPVFDFDYVKIDGAKYLRAGTHGRSIYETNILGVGNEEFEIQNSEFKIDISPNPASGIVYFQFSILDSRSVLFKIYDVHGREVATVLDGRWSGGQVVRWDATNLPAGVYFYQLRAEGEKHWAVGKLLKH